uniref:DDE_Tnp_1_7 domain-containing protein n=1 Tax=Echinococcus granulosus TaxID=6210 RepID=A0A068WP05_ECHGR|nr:hypothetical protein EgrG_000100700 [Echinococcus granulosus]
MERVMDGMQKNRYLCLEIQQFRVPEFSGCACSVPRLPQRRKKTQYSGRIYIFSTEKVVGLLAWPEGQPTQRGTRRQIQEFKSGASPIPKDIPQPYYNRDEAYQYTILACSKIFRSCALRSKYFSNIWVPECKITHMFWKIEHLRQGFYLVE